MDKASGAENYAYQLQDIVVTAQKREQNLQSVPVAVTALTAATVDRARITNVTALTALVPNLSTTLAAGGNPIPVINIRGLAGGSGILGADNPVSIYVDGVYQGDYFGAIQDVADIQRIEVLRGPQGTLFGRNSTGGAISFITTDPTGQFGVKQSISIGNYASRRFKTTINLPEWNHVSIAATYLHQERRGDTRNLGAGTVYDFTDQTVGQVGKLKSPKRLGGGNSDALHVAVKYQPTDDLRFDYRFDWLDTVDEPDARQVLGFSDGTGGAFSRLVLGAQPGGYESLISVKRLDAVNAALSQNNRIRGLNNSLTASWKLSDTVSLKNIAAYRVLKMGTKSNQIDGAGGLVITPAINFLCGGPACDGDPFILLVIGAQRRTNYQFSDEFQLNVDTEKFNLVAGYYYYNQLTKERPPPATVAFTAAPDFVFPGPPTGNSEAKIRSNALFAQLTWHLTDTLDITGGVRSTWDYKRILEFDIRYPSFKKNRIDYLANIAYTIRPGLLTYAKISTGYQSGGVTHGVAYNPETVTAYEAGLKGDFLDRRLRFNAAAFYTDYKDLQFATFDTVDGSRTRNAGRARIWGLEAETTVIPAEGVTLSGNIGYTNFKYRELDPKVGIVGRYAPVNRPKMTGSVALNYTMPEFNWGTVAFDIDAQYRGSQSLVPRHIANDPALDDVLFHNSQWLLNMRATVADIPLSGNAKAKLSAWVRNLTNDKTIVNALDLSSVVVGAFQRPRTYGLDVEFKF
ncbi:TonB-dependent receptor [Flavisphingomonas formosensis]|uniref:TonB-dependent receptor n=1 Tax=Flavisphingomonas formosensis TaxID=861534 RepID=UPI0018DF81CA|nr:TonB-dependent receptor [Sphingomonas formosensis]